ncbi:TPA: hypothetical protein HA246_00840 [Candidatus Woesearchaeota archaeon]|nr:hypothetical protein [Candidatus Woesearchaeota archaeon]
METKIKVFIDTNFLLIPAMFKVDIFREIERICNFNYELYIIDRTLDELKNIIASQKSAGKHKAASKLGLKLTENAIQENKLSLYKTDAPEDAVVDRILLDIAKHEKIIVATQDRQLKQYLRSFGMKIIDLRKKQYLIIT